MAGRIGWLFSLDHGHTTQFLNFRECWAEREHLSCEWIAMDGAGSGDWLSEMARVPRGVRHRRNELWHARARLAAHGDWGALFFASENTRLLSYVRRYPSYLYTDFTPSLKLELAPWYRHQFSKSPALQAVKDLAHARLYRASRGVFTMSRWAKVGVTADYGIPPKRVHVSLPGANLRRWHWADRSDRTNGPVKILMVGGEFRRKGGQQLVDWARQTKARNFELHMVTWPDHLPSWIRGHLPNATREVVSHHTLGPELPNVHVHCGLHANSPILADLYRQADVFCLPTHADGSSIASLEAMATGLPVLVGAVGGIPELIEEGRTGYLLPPGDETALSRLLEPLLEDRALRQRVGLAARKACESYFNIERQIAEILAVISRDGYI